ncbi:hypothetical protein [Marinospirillum perlucidum]|uniref:hypothetical protein n=1 Tax=Marinospirillum perlucidum TaxID=1982602 RepID=UPI000DF46A36|nr:hypothetical protein [Marinospirillum perlucidum]
MVLNPLAVVLLAQLGILLLVIIFYQRLQKKRLIRELEGLKAGGAPQEPGLNLGSGAGFDYEHASLLLNRINQNCHEIMTEAPAAKELCGHQQELVEALSECLDIGLDQPAKSKAPAAAAAAAPAAAETVLADDDAEEDDDDILSQADLDEALGESPADLEGLEGLDDELEGLDDIPQEGSAEEPEEYDPLVSSDRVDDDEDDLPEDTLQKTLDNLDEFDFSDLEEELLGDDDKK